jgi:hypothetical protein
MWIEHYLWQGVEHFYLIDNDSNDNPMDILQEYIDQGIVTYAFLPEKASQTKHYHTVFKNEDLKSKTYWLIVCDLDEFFFGVDKKLKTKLSQLDNYYDYILCNWKMFGTDGNITHPADIRIDIVHRVNELNENTKYIFKTSIINDVTDINIHWLNTKIKRKRIANQLVQLNHYPIQSLDFFQKVKMTRGAADTNENVRDMNYFHKYNENMTCCDEILKNLILSPPDDY